MPEANWIERIQSNFMQHPGSRLLGGISLPLKGKYHHLGDTVVVQAGMYLTLGLEAIRMRDIDIFRVGVSHDMATTARAYETVNGFEQTTIRPRISTQ